MLVNVDDVVSDRLRAAKLVESLVGRCNRLFSGRLYFFHLRLLERKLFLNSFGGSLLSGRWGSLGCLFRGLGRFLSRPCDFFLVPQLARSPQW